MSSEHTIFFADVLQEANVVHHVARLRLAQITAGGELSPAGTLIVPVQQLPGLARALNSLVEHLHAHAEQSSETFAAQESAPQPRSALYEPPAHQERSRYGQDDHQTHPDYSAYDENLG